MYRILLIDDEEKLRSLLARIISLEGFDVVQAGTCKAALKQLEHNTFDIVLCDVKLPDGNGVDFSRSVKERCPDLEIILLTAYGNIPDSVQAIKNGVFDYLVKGDDNNKIVPLLYRAGEKAALAKRIRQLQRQVGRQYSFDNIIGTSSRIQESLSLARKVAGTDATVLLLGETGTGKEVFAQAIHQASARSGKPFVAVNCSAFSRDLLESEMFGHTAGAFTGALRDTKGLLEEAHTGTLFLDEIGEMNLELQAKLLRVLETQSFIKIGKTTPTNVDVRIIAATHRNLQQEINDGHFREDLFYRLSVFQITLPPLRERSADLEPLARHFIALYAAKTNKKIERISPLYFEVLQQYHWPGNIRELKNAVERSLILCSGAELGPDLLPGNLQSTAPGRQLSAFELASAEKLHIQKVLNHTNGNKTEAARLLNIAVTTLYRKLEEYKIG